MVAAAVFLTDRHACHLRGRLGGCNERLYCHIRDNEIKAPVCASTYLGCAVAEEWGCLLVPAGVSGQGMVWGSFYHRVPWLAVPWAVPRVGV